MDIEAKYKEALERAKESMRDGAISQDTIDNLYSIFPELKESKEERIRKAILSGLKYLETELGWDSVGDVDISDTYAWLEKQAESDETKAKAFLINKGYPIDANGVFPTYEEIYNIISEGLEKLGESKANGTWFNTKDTTAPSERDIVGWYKTDGKLESCPMTVWFCNEEEARKEAEENNDCFLAYWAELPEQNFEKNYWFEKQEEKPIGKTALEAIKEEKADNANKVVPKDYNSIDPHFAKPTDNVEPKFKVGDWITNGHCKCQITFIDSRYWYSETSVLGNTKDIDKTFHLWTIADAKDGDVLYIKYNKVEWITIFKSLYSEGYIIDYCLYCINGGFYGNSAPWGKVMEFDTVFPATKEQRNLLFQKMKEAGYEWDGEKKELKKIEDEPKNYKQQLMSEMTNLLKDYIRQKHDWGEEDYYKVQRICKYLNEVKKYYADITEVRECIEWLKSLKDRVQPQPKQEWSEEDEITYKALINLTDEYDTLYCDSRKEFSDWLESIKQRLGGEK